MAVAYKNLAISRHEVRFFSDASEQIWIRLTKIVNEFKQIGLIGFLIMNATIVGYTRKPS